jgi:hypothetical protein
MSTNKDAAEEKTCPDPPHWANWATVPPVLEPVELVVVVEALVIVATVVVLVALVVVPAPVDEAGGVWKERGDWTLGLLKGGNLQIRQIRLRARLEDRADESGKSQKLQV